MNTPNPTPSTSRMNVRFFLAAIASSLVAVGALVLLMNIFERKQEAKNPFFRVVELTDETTDPAVWGKNFPMQYDDYRRTAAAMPSLARPHRPILAASCRSRRSRRTPA